uniref:Uncharacterized protein n=1 Tax=Arundo donax TaxID=35708 RepID=A0A0A9AXS6_ARUDO
MVEWDIPKLQISDS